MCIHVKLVNEFIKKYELNPFWLLVICVDFISLYHVRRCK